VSAGTITSGGSVIDLDLTNRGFLTGALVCNGAFLNDVGGTLRVSTGNGHAVYSFTHPSGLVNDGTITIGSTGNGQNTLAVANGPLTNYGLINTANSRGFTQTIAAELVNEATGVLDSLNAPIALSGAQHINRGQILGYNLNIHGSSFTLDGGSIKLSGNPLVLSGGDFVHVSGTIIGPGALSFGGMHLTGNPLVNPAGVSVTLSDGSVIDLDLTNRGFLTGFNLVCNGTFLNDVGGTLRVITGNSNGVYLFNHPSGIVNNGTITIGSNGNGSNTLSVPNGPLTNYGLINTADRWAQTINAELINESAGVLDATDRTLVLSLGGAQQINRGVFRGGHITVGGDIQFAAGSAVQGPGTLVLLGGAISVGEPGGPEAIATLNVGGDLTLGSGATLNVDLGGTTPGSQHDQVNVVGDLDTRAGSLAIGLVPGHVPEPGTFYQIMTYADDIATRTVNGSFGGRISGLDLCPGLILILVRDHRGRRSDT
jgi:hypothetical protein